MSSPSPFKTPEGEAKFLAAYDAALKLWPVPYEELDIPTRFGMTHVVAAGPKDAPALVLLHGYMATSVMWEPNIADVSGDYRVYAIDVMGQPSKSVPDDPIRNATDYVAWLTATLDGLDLSRVSLVGMSFGGWIALRYAVSAPERIQRLVLLSPGGFLPMVKQFSLRGMLMAFFPTRFTVNSFMRWAGFTDMDARPVLDLMYLGTKHFRMPKDTMRGNRDAANPLSDNELRSLHMPVLLLFGDGEVIYDSAQAFDRARRLIPHFEGELIPRCRHDMCFSQSRIVDARVARFPEGERRPASGHGTAFGSVMHPRRGHRRIPMRFTFLVILTLTVVYWFPVRRWFGRWGTTDGDLTRVMAGDPVIANPTHSATHAVTVAAPPEDIWPWLVQMGYRRGGLYSYDWLDRLFGYLDRPSANRVLPEFQQLAVGDVIPLGRGKGFPVTAIEPYRALVLSDTNDGFQWVWQFGLYPLDEGRTRLVSRGTQRFANTIGTWLFMRVIEPAAFIMTRRMLLGLKQRAEAMRAARTGDGRANRQAA